MAFNTVPVHGKYAAVYMYRPNGFKGVGLNDVTWGTGYSGGGSSADFEVVIFSEGTPDTYKYRKNGGAWDDNASAGYNITGAAQTLSDSQTITFAATTGHTADDQWAVGNLDTEATTEVSATAQITESTHRLCIPQKLTWTDGGGKTVLYEEFAEGKATFSGNVGTVTVSGNNAYIIPSGLQQIGYLTNWTLNLGVELTSVKRCGQDWDESVVGFGSGSGTAERYFVATKSFFHSVKENVEDTGEAFFLLELFTYDVDKDQTGDMFKVWTSFSSFGTAVSLSDAVKENISFTTFGQPSLIAAT